MAENVIQANRGTVDIQNPQHTSFATRQDTHINFAFEEFEITADNTPTLGAKSKYIIDKKTENHLLTNLKLQITLAEITITSNPSITGATWLNWVNSIGHAAIKNITISSGTNDLETHTGEFLEIWNELNIDPDSTYNTHIGKYKTNPPTGETTIPQKKMTVQLQYWFCRGASGRDGIDGTKLALPIGYLNNNMEITVNFQNEYNLVYTDGTIDSSLTSTEIKIDDCKLIVEYALLDTLKTHENNEIITLSQNFYRDYKQQITINQSVAFNGTATASGTKNVNWKSFTSSVIEMIWYIQKEKTDASTLQERFNFRFSGGNILSNCSFEINNDSISKDLPAEYFCKVMPLTAKHQVPRKKVHIYPFAILPSKFSNPTGFFNCTYTSQSKLKLTFSTFTGAYEGELYALTRKIIYISGGTFIIQDII